MKNIKLIFKRLSSSLVFSYSVNVWLAIKLLHWGIYNSSRVAPLSHIRRSKYDYGIKQFKVNWFQLFLLRKMNTGLCRAFTTTFTRRRLCPKRTMQSLSLLLECHGQFSHWGDFSCNFCCNFNRRSHVIFEPALGQPSPVGNGWWRPKVKCFSWFLFILIKKLFLLLFSTCFRAS